MLITLSVQTYLGEAMPVALSIRFDQLGGAIGRAVGNALVLDDPSKYISRVHARIEYNGGAYCIVDVGSNPSLVNERPVGQGRQVQLADGDKIRIGDYVLVAAVQSEARPVLPPSPLQSATPEPAPPPVPFNADDSLAAARILDIGGELNNPSFDPLGLDLLRRDDPFAPPPMPSAPAYRGAESDHVSPEVVPFQMPVSPAPMAIPDDYDPLADFLPPPVAKASPVPAPASGRASDDPVIKALMRGMGLAELNDKRSAEEVAELAGAMLREATVGTMGVLMARAMTKKESRLDMTMISSQANNPLKFFPDPDSALTQMMNASMPGYMAPVRAYANAFDDLKAHELAIMAGMRAALGGVLRRFDPAAIEQRLQVPTVMDKMMSANRKAKMWDRMVELYQQMALEADEDFQRLFGETFGRAYEEQIQRLQKDRR